MIYNTLGRSGIRISAIGFGAMRWLSEETCARIVQRGLDLGINYIDTSTGYVGGRSEVWSANAVRGRRDEVYFSAKSNWDDAPSADDVRRAIEASLERTGLDCLDFYQVWGLQRPEALEKALARGGTVEGVRKAMDDGLVRKGLGFTFHGTPELFRAAVDSGEFMCATVSYNLLKRSEEAQIDYAAAKGVGVIIMNPLAGGVLAMAGDRLGFLRGDAAGPWWGALRFLLANRRISTSLVGFTEVSEVDAAARALDGAADLGEDWRRGLARRMDEVEFVKGSFCTGCGYCKDCPEGFDPTRFMKAMRDFAVYGVPEDSLAAWLTSKYVGQDPAAQLARCVECGRCETMCPQHLGIVDGIRRARRALGERA